MLICIIGGMLKIYRTVNHKLTKLQHFEKGCWINLVKPTEQEIEIVAKKLKIEPEFLTAALDREEGSRIEADEEEATLMVVDIPVLDRSVESLTYETIPLGILLTDHYLVTVCLEENLVLKPFEEGRVKNLTTMMKTRFIMRLLYQNALVYLNYLRKIDRAIDVVEKEIASSMKNSEIFQMMNLKKSLVYFAASLKTNRMVLGRLVKVDRIGKYSEADADFLEDAILETDQAIEMTAIYSGTLDSTMATSAAVIANNQNTVMKFLAAVTILLNIPSIIFGFYGINVDLPGAVEAEWFFIVPILIAVGLSGLAGWVFLKKKYI